jgi:ACT domain-containing protein
MSGGSFDYLYATFDAFDIPRGSVERMVSSLEQEAAAGDADLILPFADALSALAAEIEAEKKRLNEKFNTFREVCKAHELYVSKDGDRKDVIEALKAWKEKA